MHTNYQPLKPATNKLLKKRWDGAAQDLHRKKVSTAKSVVDTNSPATYTHLQCKLKKMQLEEERHAVIDRDNRHLLEKMSAIMRTRGRVDNWNAYAPKSLNKSKRTRELIRVTLENQKILARIQAKQPQYSAKKWEDEWMETKQYMKSIRKYSEDWYQVMEEEKRRGSRRSRSTRASTRAVTREKTAATAATASDDESKASEKPKSPSPSPSKPKSRAGSGKAKTPAAPTTPPKSSAPATPAKSEAEKKGESPVTVPTDANPPVAE